MMNERIKELSDKCGLAWTLKTEQDVKNLVEFAELIVRECVEVGAQAFLKDNRIVPVFPANQIKQHFGVE